MITSSISVLSKSYVFDPRPRLPFQIVAKRYWVGECPDAIDDGAVANSREDVLTPVFLHGNGGHKEQWETIIQRLFQNQHSATQSAVRFRDMWSIDMPNQGDSAVLNEELLRWGYDIFSWEHYTRGVHAFLAGLGTGVEVDFSKRNLALAGHSLAGNVALLVTTYHPPLKILSFHLLEPLLLSEKAREWGLRFDDSTSRRKDTWPSSEEAFQELKTRPFYCTWDERILKLLTEHALRPLPTAEHPDLKEGVTLKCTKKQQAATFRDRTTCIIGWRYLPHVLKEIPTHITYGAIADFVPEEWQQDALHIASGGISNFASVNRIPGAGHTIVQSHPDAVADVVWKCLNRPHKLSPRDPVAAKL